ncbi:SBBP repeat-containing protein [Pyxidicoccus caerfyrddinensis]|uniref:SBBP repeat-containing protein n=1 Tax=Pyxidicoccus caerfyrddinensis TaxID=2709663 RepID=UPI0013DC01CB|nr:SBBP repeat-containing protein [Pyxidicoccus caerfyrddinensis]
MRGNVARSFALAVLTLATQASAAVSKDIVAGDRRSAATVQSQNAYASYVSPADKVVHVSLAGSDSTGDGSAARPWRSVVRAVRGLPAGSTVYVHAGIYDAVQVDLASASALDGTAAAPITVRGAPGEAKPVLKSNGSVPIFRLNRRYWIIDGLELDGRYARTHAVLFRSDHLTLRNSLVRDASLDALNVQAQYVLIQDNELRNTFEHTAGSARGVACTTHADCSAGSFCKPEYDASNVLRRYCRERDDGHAIVVLSDSHSVLVKGNTIHDNTGDGLQCAGPLYGYTPGARPADITLEDNDMFTSPANQGVVEEAADIKDCDFITLRRERYHGFRAAKDSSGTLRGGGTAIFHFSAQGIRVEDSEISDACMGLGVGNSATDPVANIVVARTRFHHLYWGEKGCGNNSTSGTAMYVQKLDGGDFFHNTISQAGRMGVVVSGAGWTVRNMDFWNNVISLSAAGSRWLVTDGHYLLDFESDGNLYSHTDGSAAHLTCDFSQGEKDLSGWRSSACGIGGLTLRDPTSSAAAAAFTQESAGDLTLQSTSPAVDSALNNTGATFCGSGPDKGALERCTTTTPPPTGGDLLWQQQTGTSSDEYGYAVTADPNGGAYVVGYSLGAFDYDNQGGRDAVLRHYSASGSRDWGRQLGAAGDDHAYGAAATSAAVVMGGNAGSGLADEAYLGGTSDGFVAKYNTLGTREWVRMLGTSAEDSVRAVATDGTSFFVAGYTSGSLQATNAGLKDAFVAKYSAAGALLWVRMLGTSSDDLAYGVAADSGGNVYVTGVTSGSMQGAASSGGQDVFLAKYSAAGTLAWVRQWGSAGNDVAQDVEVDGTGAIVVGGSTTGALAFDNQGGSDAFVSRWTSAGDRQWARQLGTAADEFGYGIATDSSGTVYLAGSSTGTLAPGYAGGFDAYLTRYASDGTRGWTQHLGSATDEVALGAATTTGNGVYLVGGTMGTLPGQTSAGGKDLFLGRYSP